MSIIVNIGVLMWIVAISFFTGMIVGTVIMVHAFSKGKKNMTVKVIIFCLMRMILKK